MQIHRRGGALCALILVGALAPAHWASATVTLTADSRQWINDILLTELFAPDVDLGPVTTLPPSFAATFNVVTGWVNEDTISGAARATSQASMVSSIGGGVTNLGTNSATITATGYGMINGQTDGDATSFSRADSNFVVEFLTNASYNYHFFGNLSKVGTTNVRARLMQVGGSDIQNTINTGDFDWSGTLLPGTYRMEVYGRAQANIGPDLSFARRADYSSTLQLTIPEPASLVLLAFGTLGVVRRRR
jgi:hypothetical protein